LLNLAKCFLALWLLLLGLAQGKSVYTAEPPLGNFSVKFSKVSGFLPPATPERIRKIDLLNYECASGGSYDGTGHVCALTDINKNLLATYQYSPFGEKISATGSYANSNPWRYQTKYLDEETGLYYFGHRYYDPITGLFLSRDKLGEDEDLHLYRMTGNDPINFVDRFGLAQVATDGRGELTTFGQALMTIAKDDPDAARKILLAAQVNREISEANIDSLIGDGDGDAISSVVSAIDLAVGSARSDGRDEWRKIDLKIRDGGGSRIGEFDNGRPTQKLWKDAYLAEYLPALASSAALAAENKALQSAAIQKEQAVRNTSTFRLKQIGQATADLPMHVGAFAFSAAFVTDVTTGSAVTWNGWGNGFGLAEVTPGERAVAGALLLAGPLGRVESVGDDLVRTGMRGRSFAGTASRPWMTKAANTIDSAAVRFSQSSISRNFSAGGTIDDLAAGLRSGSVNPNSIPPIRLVEREGSMFTLDNRRLWSFQQAEVPIPYRMATPQEAAAEAWKFTTPNGGTSIRVRGQ